MMKLKRAGFLLLTLLLLAGCAGKETAPAVAQTADPGAPAPTSAPETEDAAVPTAETAPLPGEAGETDGWENLGAFLLQPENGVLEAPMMGLRLPLSGELLRCADRLSAEVYVERTEAALYLSMTAGEGGAEDDVPLLVIWGYPEDQQEEPGFVYLGKNDTFYYYFTDLKEMFADDPDTLAMLAEGLEEEDAGIYAALRDDAGRLFASAEILPLTLPGSLEGDALGKLFTDAVLQDLEGNDAALGDLIRGQKLTLLNVWGTFCGPCIREMPDLGDLARDYADRGFGVVGLTCDILDASGQVQSDVAEDALDILASTGVDYPVLILSNEMARALELMYVPTSFFVDSQGHVLDGPLTGSMSGEDWRSLIEQHLAEVG